jgi:hypothetical protein
MSEFPTGRNLVFIVGAPRSGTTWLQRLLASHPRVRTGQESNLFSGYLGPLLRSWRRELDNESDPDRATGRGGVGLPCYFTEQEFMEVFGEFAARLLAGVTRGLEPGELFLEKTPDHALFVPEITRMLPESRVIHILRDPRDVVSSLLAASRDWGRAWAPRAAGPAAERWARHVRAARRAGDGLPPGRYREIHYEDLVADTVGKVADLACFLDLEWSDEAIREAVEANRPESIRSGGGTPIRIGGALARGGEVVVREPRGFVRLDEQRTWKSELSLLQRLRVWRSVRDLMRECGYVWPASDWL